MSAFSYLVAVAIGAAILGIIPGAIARNKGYDFWGWWFFGAVLFIVALPVVIVLKPNTETDYEKRVSTGEMKVCTCGNVVLASVSICPKCGNDISKVVPRLDDLRKAQAHDRQEAETATREQAKHELMIGGGLVIAVILALGIFILLRVINY